MYKVIRQYQMNNETDLTFQRDNHENHKRLTHLQLQI